MTLVSSSNLTVVLFAAGEGHRMRNLTKFLPKAMLPVAGRPLLSYSLLSLVQAGFQDLIVIIQEEDIQLASYLQAYETRVNLTVVTIEREISTIGALLRVSNLITGDFIIMSSDLISDCNFSKIIDLHMISNSSLTILLSDLSREEQELPYERRDKAASEIVVYDEDTNRLLALINAADMNNKFRLSRTILRKYPRLRYTTCWQDCYLYVCKHWILSFLKDWNAMESVKWELLPLLVTAFLTYRSPM
jgi:ADP-glucose pyrophosphorylase